MFGASPPPTKVARTSYSTSLGQPHQTPARTGGLQFGGGQGGVASSRLGAGVAFNPHDLANCAIGSNVTYVQDKQGNVKLWLTDSAPSLQSLGDVKKAALRPFATRGGRSKTLGGRSGAAPFIGEGDNGSVYMAGTDGEVRRVNGESNVTLDYFCPDGEAGNMTAVTFASMATEINGSPTAAAAFVDVDGSIFVKPDMCVGGRPVEISAQDLTNYLKELHDAAVAAKAAENADGESSEEEVAQSGGGGWFGWLSGRSKKKVKKQKKKVDGGASPAPSSNASGLDDSNLSSIAGGSAIPPFLQFAEQGALLFYAVDVHLFIFDVVAEGEVTIRQYVDLSSLGAGTQVLSITTDQVNQKDTRCYCLVGEVSHDLPAAGDGDDSAASNDSCLTVVQFSVTQGRLIGQHVNLSFKRNHAPHVAIHALGGKVLVVAGNCLATVNLGGQGLRHPSGDEPRALNETVFGSAVKKTANNTPSLLLFNKNGFTLEALHVITAGAGAAAAAGTGLGGSKVVSQILQATQGSRPTERPDEVALSASEDVVNAIDKNPTNWARSNMDVEDRNLMNFVTAGLTRRCESHIQLLNDIFGSQPALQLLKPQTQASLLSSQQKLSALLALRILQNEERTSIQVEDRQDVLKKAVVAVGHQVQLERNSRIAGSADNMTAAELAYSNTAHGPLPLLFQVNEELNRVGSSPCPLDVKVKKAIACGEIWAAVLAALNDQTLAYNSNPKAKIFLWVSSHDFCSELRRIAFMMSDILGMMVTQKPEEEGGADAAAFQVSGSESAHRFQAELSSVLGILDQAVDCLLSYHPESASISTDLLHRTMLRSPFFNNDGCGYPHGAPEPTAVPLAGGMNTQAVLDAAEGLATKYKVHEVLFEFACSDVHDALADLAAEFGAKDDDDAGGYTAKQVSRLNAYIKADGSFYPYILGRLVTQNREREVEVLPGYISGEVLRDPVGDRNNYIAKNYPELHWLFEDFPMQSMLQDAREAGGHHPNPVVYGDDAVEHCINTLSLASLAWVASGRPNEAKHPLEHSKHIARVQNSTLPELREKNLSDETIVAALLKKPEPECWIEATGVAHHTADTALRDRLLLSCLLHSATVEGKLFTEILNDGAAGDNERKSRIDKSTTAQVCQASTALMQKLRSRDKVLGADMAQQRLGDVHSLLTDWSRSAS